MGSPENPRQTSLSSLSCPVATTHPIRASVTSDLGCDSGLQGPPIRHLSQLSWAQPTRLPRAPASPSSERPKEHSPASSSRSLKPCQRSLLSPFGAPPPCFLVSSGALMRFRAYSSSITVGSPVP